uniref:phosphatase PAP2 family protein n=1 Tax=Thaumasiovibrio occultus TaxID=1891184 RepID=UPI000B35F3E1|nr:phosphatase PAP2 family protein [Thaumasiovibrio occultus]
MRLATIGILCSALPLSAVANQDNWELASEIGVYSLIGFSLAKPAYHQDWQGFQQAGLSVGVAGGIGLIGKSTIDAERPDKSGNNSFPSNHTSTAFAAATSLHKRYGWEYGVPAYGVATLVGVGRVEGEKHYWRDVAAGAVIGIASGWLLTDKLDDNSQLWPWVSKDQVGLSYTYLW